MGSNLVHLAAGRWKATDSREVPLSLTAIDLLSASDGWAMGHGAKGPHELDGPKIALLLRAGVWGEPIALPSDAWIRDLKLMSPTEGWAVGETRSGIRITAAVFRLHDGVWTASGSFGPDDGLWLDQDGTGWAVGSRGRILRMDGIDKILRHLREKGRDARAGPWATGPPGGGAGAEKV